MPQALAFVAPGVFAAGGSAALFTAAGSLTIAGIGVSIGGSLLLSHVSERLSRQRTPDAARPENVRVNSKTAAAPRIRHYGVVKAGGNAVFHRAKDGVSYRVIVHGHGEISAIRKHYLNNEDVTLDGFGFVTDAQYQLDRPRVRILSRSGAAPAAHYAEIADIWPEWTAAHRLDGLWTSLIICESVTQEKFPEMYPRGEPELTVLADTTPCFDPRTGQTGPTENMALAIANFVASPDGMNRPGAFDWTDIAAQADICDRDVPLASGGSEKMYRIGGSYLLNERPQDVLIRMLNACAGRVRLKPSGKLGLKVGAWTEPKFTLTSSDVLEVEAVTSGPDLLDRYNELPGRFNSHDLGHVEVDAEPWLDQMRVAEDGAVLTGPDKNFLFSPSHRQTRQVMEIHTERDNPKQQIDFLCKPRALPAIYEDVIFVDVPEMGLSGTFEVDAHRATFEKGLLRSVWMSLRKFDSSAMSQALEDQGAVQQMPEPDTPSGVPVPQNVTAAAAGIQSAANAFSAGIAVAWQAPPSDALSPYVRITRSGQDAWQDVVTGPSATSVTVPGLSDGASYDISVAFVTPGAIIGEAVIVANVVAAAVSNPPLPPTGLQVTDAGAGQALVEMTASTSTALWKTEIYRDLALVGTVFSQPGQAIAFSDACGPGDFDWAARSINISNIASASDAGPVTATIA